MFYFFKSSKKWGNWSRALPEKLDSLLLFLQPHEHYSVSFTSRLSDGRGRFEPSMFNKNTIFVEEVNNVIISAVMLSPEGIICPIFTDDSSLQPLKAIINSSAYAKKSYLTLMGLKNDITAAENLFEDKKRISVDYALLTAYSSMIPSCIDTYLNKKNKGILEHFKIYRAVPSNIDELMPLRTAYELEEVLLNPSQFNETACRNRYLRTITEETVFVAEIEGMPTATCCISSSGFNWDQIGGVFTKPEYRSNGLSALLMAEIAKLSERNNKNLMLFVKKDNRAALKLYSNCGFEQSGEYRISYLERR